MSLKDYIPNKNVRRVIASVIMLSLLYLFTKGVITCVELVADAYSATYVNTFFALVFTFVYLSGVFYLFKKKVLDNMTPIQILTRFGIGTTVTSFLVTLAISSPVILLQKVLGIETSAVKVTGVVLSIVMYFLIGAIFNPNAFNGKEKKS